MKRYTKYNRVITITNMKAILCIIVLAFFLLPSCPKITNDTDTVFRVLLDGELMGVVSDTDKIDNYLTIARRRITKKAGAMVLASADLQVEGEKKFFAKVSSKKTLVNNMYQLLKKNSRNVGTRAYTIKINEFTVNVGSSEEVKSVLQAALNQYDTKGKYTVDLVLDSARELNVLTASVETSEEAKKKMEEPELILLAGIGQTLEEMLKDVQPAVEKKFSDFDLGLVDIAYGDDIEVVETYLPAEQITPLTEAVELATVCQEKDAIYEVTDGDTLSEIAMKVNLPMDRIIELNENLENENSTIRVGDELVITTPEPALSLEYKEEAYYEQDYDAETEYIYNDAWYTTESQIRQQPSAGHRKVIALVSHRNDKVTGTEILKEEVVMEAVPKVVEVGTKVPPTYIKPISGGRLTSGFKKRWGRWHKGIDWAIPVGTAVMASNGGTVARAGWGSGYGYVIYINHADGRQTRYGHLSKVLVKPGQVVKQGQKIALSGNTGRSTGPHLHFEILINGGQVNPLQHMN